MRLKIRLGCTKSITYSKDNEKYRAVLFNRGSAEDVVRTRKDSADHVEQVFSTNV